MTTDSASKRTRILVFGIDGATLDLARPFAEQGIMPNLKRLMDAGISGDMQSTIPPITPPAWTTFYTGTNSGKHGIFDFDRRSKESYRIIPTNSSFIDGEFFWQTLSKAGKRVGVFNAPLTHPPEPLNGITVSGIMTPPGAETFTYPPEFGDELTKNVKGYSIWPPEVVSSHKNENSYLDSADALVKAQTDAMLYTMDKVGDWDFFMGVVQFPDQIEHTFWHHMDPTHPKHDPKAPARWKNAIRDNYALLDQQLGRVLEKAGPDTTVFVISDHGAGPIDTDIHLNTWLMHKGWLHLKNDKMTRVKKLLYRLDVTPARAFKMGFALGLGGAARKTFKRKGRGVLSMADRVFLSFQDVDWKRTRAYAFGTYACIYVNLKGREPSGIVEPGADYDRTVDGITADLMQMRDPRNNKLLVDRVYRNSEIYSGPRSDEGPDLVLFPRDGRYHPFGLFKFASRKWLQPPFDGRSGWHRMNAVLVGAGPGLPKGTIVEGARFMDLMPNILMALDVPIPSHVDGQVLPQLWEPEFIAAHTVTVAEGAGEIERTHQEYSEEDEELVSQRLADLGY